MNIEGGETITGSEEEIGKVIYDLISGIQEYKGIAEELKSSFNRGYNIGYSDAMEEVNEIEEEEYNEGYKQGYMFGRAEKEVIEEYGKYALPVLLRRLNIKSV